MTGGGAGATDILGRRFRRGLLLVLVTTAGSPLVVLRRGPTRADPLGFSQAHLLLSTSRIGEFTSITSSLGARRPGKKSAAHLWKGGDSEWRPRKLTSRSTRA